VVGVTGSFICGEDGEVLAGALPAFSSLDNLAVFVQLQQLHEYRCNRRVLEMVTNGNRWWGMSPSQER